MLYTVMEQFYTLQGEGAHQGSGSYFIRLAGCNVGCVWCDVKESWDAAGYPRLSVESLVNNALKHPARMVVITGGEPLMHDLTELTQALQAAGFSTHLETSGSSPLTGKWDWITFSPKKFMAPLPQVAQAAHELKIIVFNKSDLQWAEEQAVTVNPSCALYLQPEWSKRTDMMPLIVAYVMAHPQWKVSLQTHKYLQIP